MASSTVGRELSVRSEAALAAPNAALTLPRRSCLLFNCDYYNTMSRLGQGSGVPEGEFGTEVNSEE